MWTCHKSSCHAECCHTVGKRVYGPSPDSSLQPITDTPGPGRDTACTRNIIATLLLKVITSTYIHNDGWYALPVLPCKGNTAEGCGVPRLRRLNAKPPYGPPYGPSWSDCSSREIAVLGLQTGSAGQRGQPLRSHRCAGAAGSNRSKAASTITAAGVITARTCVCFITHVAQSARMPLYRCTV
jgi:hypothetical protein